VVVGASREEAHGARASVAMCEAVAAHTSTAVVVTRAGLSEVAGPILVGVDGSAAGASALEFAFAEAAVHGVAVHPTLVWTGAPGGPPAAHWRSCDRQAKSDSPPFVRDAVVPIGPSRTVASALSEGGRRGDGRGEPINMDQCVNHRP
jgi:hypothetical protein